MENFIDILFQQLSLYGVSLLGTFAVAIAFSVFYGKNTQYNRFYLISQGFWILFFTFLILIVAPCLPLLNPAIQIPTIVTEAFIAVLYGVASGFFMASLFPSLPRKILIFLLPTFFTLLFFAAAYGLLLLDLTYLPPSRIPTLLLGATLVVASMGFHAIPAISQKAIFTAPRIGLFTLGLYFVLFAFNLISEAPAILLILYGLIAIVVLIAQLNFMESTAIAYQEALEAEKKNKTLFWDVAPFPILLTKLMDDSVVYMNSACQSVLGLNDEQKKNMRFSAYFAKPEKRLELIDLTKLKQVVDNFEVELNVQNSEQKTLWITLSSRVFEVDGELVLYINFTNITAQKETEQELFVQASTDTLTGLYNRRQFFALSEQAFALAAREKTSYCALMLDIDHFKNINDTYGHDAGDIVLKHLADILKKTLRKSDIVARWGGEEFIVFLQNTPPKNGIEPAEKLRKAVEETAVKVGDKIIRFTISLGVSLSQTPDVALIQKEADLALYHSKENGRNQTTLYSPELEMPTEVESDR
ncbi:MAG: diguanylate cyclase [Alphaproteobacteria bacterium]|nr:diguanylate cyclase [Alphaproteobacteria bacterium]